MGLYLKFKQTKFTFFVNGSITLNYASVCSKFSLDAVYDDQDPNHKELFKPLSFAEVKVYADNDELLLTGVVTGVQNKSQSKQAVVKITGYSKTGVLQDCRIPASLYPLEYNGLTLLEIAEKLTQPFGIKVKAVNDNGIASEVIPEITANSSQSISGFLDEIAAQRNLVLTHDEYGNLLITRLLTTVRSIATYTDEIPSISITLTTNGQGMHSETTVMKQAGIINDNVSQETVENPLISVYRPTVKSQDTGNDVTAIDAAKNARANELRGIKLGIHSDRWEWLNNYQNDKKEVARPNNIIDVISPNNYLSRRTSFFVETVTLTFDDKEETSKLSCVLPEVYNNEEPKIIFN